MWEMMCRTKWPTCPSLPSPPLSHLACLADNTTYYLETWVGRRLSSRIISTAGQKGGRGEKEAIFQPSQTHFFLRFLQPLLLLLLLLLDLSFHNRYFVCRSGRIMMKKKFYILSSLCFVLRRDGERERENDLVNQLLALWEQKNKA